LNAESWVVDIAGTWGNPNWQFQFTNEAFLQHHAIINGKTKLEAAFGSPEIEDLLNSDDLIARAKPTLIQETLKRFDGDCLIVEMRENIRKGNWIMDPHEMTLDLNYSHPLIHSFAYHNSKKFAVTRKLCVKYLIEHTELQGHQEILLSVFGICLEPSNQLTEGLEMFHNPDELSISKIVMQMKDPELPKTGDSVCDVTAM